MSIQEAATALGVSRETVYAYVSRGLLRSTPDPANPRRSAYDAREVRLLAERHGRGRSRREIAASSVAWGDPVLRSAITQVGAGQFRYRGADAVELSRSATLEEVAALLWGGPPSARLRRDPAMELPPRSTPARRCLTVLASLADLGPWTPRPELALPAASCLLRAMAAAASGVTGGAAPSRAVRPVHALLSDAWTGSQAAADVIRRCLVLCADHELNASTYAARVVASTRAPLGACVLAGLAALTGPRHGGMTDLVRTMLATPGLHADPDAVLGTMLARGKDLPGFGHRLYPGGDPRAAEILAVLPLPWRWRRVAQAAERLTGLRPNIDFALVAVERQLKLPAGAAFSVFATGRLVGWIAHAMEQWADGTLIRPRAAYAGE